MGESAVVRRRPPTLCRSCFCFCQCAVPFIIVCSLPLYKAYTQLEVPLEQKNEKKTKKSPPCFQNESSHRAYKPRLVFWSAISSFFQKKFEIGAQRWYQSTNSPIILFQIIGAVDGIKHAKRQLFLVFSCVSVFCYSR